MPDKTEPLLDLDVEAKNQELGQISWVAALPHEEAFIDSWSYRSQKVLRLNAQGQVTKNVLEAFGYPRKLGGLLLSHQYLFVIYKNGTLVEINVNNSQTVDVYYVHNVSLMFNYGSLAYDPSVIPDHDLLLLTDAQKGEVFSYNVSTKNKVVHVTGLKYPTSVSVMKVKSDLSYLVTDSNSNQILFYNSTWGLHKIIGDGRFYNPKCALGLVNGITLISDNQHGRISEYTTDGRFIRHFLTSLKYPASMSISLPYLWVVDAYTDNVLRYKLY